MPEESTEVRVSLVEAGLQNLKEDLYNYHTFRETVLTKLTKLEESITTLNWKVGGLVGIIVLIGNFLTQWGLGKLFH